MDIFTAILINRKCQTRLQYWWHNWWG